MPVRPVLIYGDPRLHEKAEPVEKIDDSILDLIDDMFETLFADDGIGLAAIQIGVKKAVIVIDLGEHEPKVRMLAMINPEITDRLGMCTFDEGCLSVPGVTAQVERPETITVRYMDRAGKTVEMECGGLLARVIQHEYDHLQGILFPQRLKQNERKRIAPDLRRLARGVVT